MPRYLIGLGSSHPQGPEYLQRAILMLDRSPFITLHATSPFSTSAAIGGATCFSFTNSAVAISTSLYADALWFKLHEIERTLGRIRAIKNAARTIDLDILWCFENTWYTRYLTIPHIELLNRHFAIRPAIQAAQLAKWPVPTCMNTSHDDLTATS